MIIFSIKIIAVLFISFVILMNLKGRLQGTRGWPTLRVVLGVPFLLLDWFVNVFILSFLFVEEPYEWKELVTQRMTRYKHLQTWRGKAARFVCRFLDFIDPRGHHC